VITPYRQDLLWLAFCHGDIKNPGSLWVLTNRTSKGACPSRTLLRFNARGITVTILTIIHSSRHFLSVLRGTISHKSSYSRPIILTRALPTRHRNFLSSAGSAGLTSRYRLACNSFGGIGWACSSAVDHFVGSSLGACTPCASEFQSGVPRVFSSFFLIFFFRIQKTASPIATKNKAPSAAPTPIPVLAPVVRPGLVRSLPVVTFPEPVALVRPVGELVDEDVLLMFVWRSDSRNRTTNGSASSVPNLMNTVAAVVVAEVVFHLLYVLVAAPD
jgi:hypothetical protein